MRQHEGNTVLPHCAIKLDRDMARTQKNCRGLHIVAHRRRASRQVRPPIQLHAGKLHIVAQYCSVARRVWLNSKLQVEAASVSALARQTKKDEQIFKQHDRRCPYQLRWQCSLAIGRRCALSASWCPGIA
eukprot:6182831-Pleurochrysis_carterae.AAC.4